MKIYSYHAASTMDYIPIRVTITLPADTPDGTRSCITLNVLEDNEIEMIEYFSLQIENQSPDVVTFFEGEGILFVHILDDDCEYT